MGVMGLLDELIGPVVGAAVGSAASAQYAAATALTVEALEEAALLSDETSPWYRDYIARQRLKRSGRYCRCDAYPWPHGICVGRCDGARVIVAVIVEEGCVLDQKSRDMRAMFDILSERDAQQPTFRHLDDEAPPPSSPLS